MRSFLITLIFSGMSIFVGAQTKEATMGLKSGVILPDFFIAETEAESNIIPFQMVISFRPDSSFIAFQLEPGMWSFEGDLEAILPLYVQFILGNDVRFTPRLGGYLRTGKGFGFTLGAGVEVKVGEKLYLFAQGEYIRDHPEVTAQNSAFSFIDVERVESLGVFIGLKYSILNW